MDRMHGLRILSDSVNSVQSLEPIEQADLIQDPPFCINVSRRSRAHGTPSAVAHEKLLWSLLFFAASVRPSPAQDPRFPGRVEPFQVRVVADHPDWTYAVGEPVTFTVTVTRANETPVTNAPVTYTVAPEMMRAEKKSAVTSATGTLTLEGGTMREPGFLRCTVTFEYGSDSYLGMATAGFAPEKIRPPQTEPADFDAFWSKAKDELAKLPLDAQLTPMPDQSNYKIEVFQVNLQNVGTPPALSSRFYGVLCVPRGPGPLSAMMVPPGAGIRAFRGQTQLAERGFITLEVGIHGVPVILPPEPYVSLNGALQDYAQLNLENRDRYYFRRVILGCLRANDYLTSHSKWDRQNLIMFGGSQGGFLSSTTTALDSRVTACNIAYPAYSDVTGYVHGRAGGLAGSALPNARGARTVREDCDDCLLRRCELRPPHQGARPLRLGLQRRNVPADLDVFRLQCDHRTQDARYFQGDGVFAGAGAHRGRTRVGVEGWTPEVDEKIG